MNKMNLKTIFALSVASVSFAACGVDEDATKSVPVQETYTRDFIKAFGTINPNQDWNVVEQKSVTINTSSPVDVLIYEKQGGEYKLAADYKGVSGSKTITFDGMEGDDTPFIVSLDGNMVPASNGETVEYNGKAASGVKRSSQIPDGTSWITRSSAATQINLDSDDSSLKLFKNENGTNHVATMMMHEKESYMEVLKAGEGTTYYPMYWNSPNVHEVGLYYYDSNSSDIIKVPMFKDHDAGDILYCKDKNNKDVFYPNEANQDESTNFESTTAGKSKKWNASYFRGFTFKSYGYTVKPTKSIVCGVYVKIGENMYYSDSNLNGGKKFFASKTITNETDGTAYTYLCFDDPSDNGGEGDKDYNDLVFYTPRTISPVTRDEISWLVTCEDLGGTFDYDFNDITFRVYHLSGNDYLTIVPAAAGGTLEAYLYYGDTQVSDEWHQHFGEGHDYTDMINTGGIEEKSVWPIRLTGVPTDFSMTNFSQADGGFKILVKKGKDTYSVTGPSNGEAPQMLILPSDWQWPVELTRITTTYPDFGTWGENYTNSKWVENKIADTFVNLKESDIKQSKEIKVVPVNQ